MGEGTLGDAWEMRRELFFLLLDLGPEIGGEGARPRRSDTRNPQERPIYGGGSGSKLISNQNHYRRGLQWQKRGQAAGWPYTGLLRLHCSMNHYFTSGSPEGLRRWMCEKTICRQYRLRNLTLCVIHSSISGSGSFAFFVTHQRAMFQDTIHWYSPFAAQLPILSMGSFASVSTSAKLPRFQVLQLVCWSSVCLLQLISSAMRWICSDMRFLNGPLNCYFTTLLPCLFSLPPCSLISSSRTPTGLCLWKSIGESSVELKTQHHFFLVAVGGWTETAFIPQKSSGEWVTWNSSIYLHLPESKVFSNAEDLQFFAFFFFFLQ